MWCRQKPNGARWSQEATGKGTGWGAPGETESRKGSPGQLLARGGDSEVESAAAAAEGNRGNRNLEDKGAFWWMPRSNPWGTWCRDNRGRLTVSFSIHYILLYCSFFCII